jgi:hypothetical protein
MRICVVEDGLQDADPALDEGLLLFGRLIIRVLREIALLDGEAQALGDLPALDRAQILELLL